MVRRPKRLSTSGRRHQPSHFLARGPAIADTICDRGVQDASSDLPPGTTDGTRSTRDASRASDEMSLMARSSVGTKLDSADELTDVRNESAPEAVAARRPSEHLPLHCGHGP